MAGRAASAPLALSPPVILHDRANLIALPIIGTLVLAGLFGYIDTMLVGAAAVSVSSCGGSGLVAQPVEVQGTSGQVLRRHYHRFRQRTACNCITCCYPLPPLLSPLYSPLPPLSSPLSLFSSIIGAVTCLQVTKAFVLYIVGDFFWILLEPKAVPSRWVLGGWADRGQVG